MGPDEWTWEFYERAKRADDRLDAHAQDRITAKLGDIAADEWRDPDEYVEPLTGAPHAKLRIGPIRLGVVDNRETKPLGGETIERRGEASSPRRRLVGLPFRSVFSRPPTGAGRSSKPR